MSEPTYLGDRVYAAFDGCYVQLTTNNGHPDDPRNRIALEPQVLANLARYLRDIGLQIKHFTEETKS